MNPISKQVYNNIVSEHCQALCNEIDVKFTPKKAETALLAESYMRLGFDSKVKRVSDCGSWLEFMCYKSEQDGGLRRGVPSGHHDGNSVGSTSHKLFHANFCRERLCPMCAWRRSYKIFAQVSHIMNYLGDDYRYIFLTLTVPNCDGKDLAKVIDDMQYGFRRLIHRKAFKNAVKGFFRALEITRNKKTGLYHPHFHVVLAVLPSYFNHSDYIPHAEWLKMWRESMKDDSITQVNIKVMRNKKTGAVSGSELGSAVAETAKYTVKSSDYIFAGSQLLTDSIVYTLTMSLYKRRLTAFGGCFQDAHDALKLDDCEDGDLIHVDSEELRSDVATMIVKYTWCAGVGYKLKEVKSLIDVDGIPVNPYTGEVL